MDTKAPQPPVPGLLVGAAAWCWRLLVVGATCYLFVLLLDRLGLLVLPFFVAVLLTALLHPAVALLRRGGAGRGAAAGLVLALSLVVLGGIGYYVANRTSAQYPQLVDQVNRVVTKTQHFLTHDLHVKAKNFHNLSQTFISQLRAHQGQIESGAIKAGRTLGEALAASVLCLFMTFFLLYDGERIWSWFVGFFPSSARTRVREAGADVWRTLTGYVAGTFIVALFHSVAVGVTLLGLGVPLVVPLAVLVFLGSFIPIVGAVVFGGLAVVIALVTHGWLAGVIVLGVLLVDNQAEAHLLQPLVVGRYVSLHPLAIAVALTGGALLAGLPGAIFAVPIVAAGNAAVSRLWAGPEPAEAEVSASPLAEPAP